MKCNDCGQEKPAGKYGTRPDVCTECWENRGWILSHATKLGMKTLREAQRKMAAGRGSAKKFIEKLKQEVEPPSVTVERYEA